MNQLEPEVFEKQLQDNVEYIERVLVSCLPAENTFQKTIFQAMEYSLMAGGKRIRPMLMLESYKMFGGTDFQVIEKFMAAMETIHTYSLVHDDLPAMDDDKYRRGRLTTHVKYGEDMGILAGDALLNYAYETACQGMKIAQDKEAAINAFDILSRKAGIYGMVGGQVVDVELTGKSLTKEQLDFIFKLKTGALIESSLMVGAALAGATKEEIACMEQVGRAVGIAFQIQDDILDVVSTTEALGKPVHSDMKNDKTTYVSLYGMEQALLDVKDYSNQGIEALAGLERESAFLETLIHSMIHRKK